MVMAVETGTKKENRLANRHPIFCTGADTMKIMIIDDSSVMRRILKNTLLEKGCADDVFYEAEDGEQAIELTIRNPIDIFLVDWNMPKVDGIKFVTTLRKIDHHKNTPVIMITAQAAKYNVMEAISAGVTDYLIKPVKGESLWERISTYIKGA
jgi:two-component system chemotaxis response regulator CheY